MPEATTQQGVEQAASQPLVPPPPKDDVDTFQSIWDAQAAEDAKLESQERPNLENASVEGETEAPEQPEQAAPEPEDAKAQGAEETKPEGEGEDEKAYGSLDEYLTASGLDRDSFMQLPVRLRVDGNDRDVPLAELVKNHQLAAASYARMNEAAQAKQTFAQEQERVRGAIRTRIDQIEKIAQVAEQQLLGDVNQIPWDKLRAENPAEYAALSTEVNQRRQQLQQILQQVSQERQTEAQAANQQTAQAVAAERERLLAARPEWRDPATLANDQRSMIEAARKFGFTDAELNQVNDHRQLLVLDAAARFLNGPQARKSAVLKKVRAAPTLPAKSGTRQIRNPKQSAYKNAVTNWSRNPRDEDAAAAVFEHLA